MKLEHAPPTASLRRAPHSLHAEIGILIVCAVVLGIGVWNGRFGTGETLAMVGVLLSARAVILALRRARPPSSAA
jgi:hypothetical protein